MANEEHLRIFRRGVKNWNEWRRKGIATRLDLSGVDFREANLNNADLSNTNLNNSNLNKAKLRKAKLSNADLNDSNLSGANLSQADLSRAYLSKVDLRGANLSNADLSKTILGYANLSDADLSKAVFIGAMAIGAIFSDANLTRANFSEADLSGAIFSEADLSEANLSGAILSESNLSGAILSEAILQKASLTAARLLYAKLDNANLTEACLWETQRAGWSIKGIVCESVYWDRDAKEKTVYVPGEFERLFADKTIIRLFYKDGISPLEIVTLPSLIQRLGETHPNARLRFVSIKEESGGAVVELAIEGDEDIQPAQLKQLQADLESEAQQKVEYQRQALAERDARLQLQGGIDYLNAVIDKLINRPTYLISGQAGAVGPHSHAHDNTFNKISDSQVQQNSPAAIQNVNLSTFNPDELSSLLKTLKDSLDQITLDDDNKSEMQSNIATLEVQIASPKPKAAIIRETLYSIRNILEGAAGSGVAAGIIEWIARLLQ